MRNHVRPTFRSGQPVIYCGPDRGNGALGTVTSQLARKNWMQRNEPEYEVSIPGRGIVRATRRELLRLRRREARAIREARASRQPGPLSAPPPPPLPPTPQYREPAVSTMRAPSGWGGSIAVTTYRR